MNRNYFKLKTSTDEEIQNFLEALTEDLVLDKVQKWPDEVRKKFHTALHNGESTDTVVETYRKFKLRQSVLAHIQREKILVWEKLDSLKQAEFTLKLFYKALRDEDALNAKSYFYDLAIVLETELLESLLRRDPSIGKAYKTLCSS